MPAVHGDGRAFNLGRYRASIAAKSSATRSFGQAAGGVDVGAAGVAAHEADAALGEGRQKTPALSLAGMPDGRRFSVQPLGSPARRLRKAAVHVGCRPCNLTPDGGWPLGLGAR